jgi:membrane-bound ClpP family serine protease
MARCHSSVCVLLGATQIARAINLRKGKVTTIVPHYAMSGGMLIALAADEIIMSDHAVLGPTVEYLPGGHPPKRKLSAED